MQRRWCQLFLLLLVAMIMSTACGPNTAQGEPLVLSDEQIPYTTEIVAQNLDVPWAIDVAPDGRLFFTERPGRVRVIQQGRLLPTPLISFPAPFVSEGEGGLLGLVLDPAFSANHYLYVYHSYEERGTIYNRVLRLRANENRASLDKILIDRIPGNIVHNGGRLKVGPDQRLYVTTGDAQNPALAQNLSSLAGKILRINLDGSIPSDNPFRGSPIYSWGHRNPQGMAWSQSGRFYSSEHGSQAYDEINLIVPGGNYGWPLIRGEEQREGMISPLIQSGDTTWAPSGISFVTKGAWRDQLLVANLRGEQLVKVQFASRAQPQIQAVNSFYHNRYGRLRDMVERPDGSLYLLTSNRDGRGTVRAGDDKIIMMKPVSMKLTK